MIENISFRLWQIDKYVSFIVKKYSNISQINNLPQFEKWLNDYEILSYKRFLRLRKKGFNVKNKDLRLSPKEKQHYNKITLEIENLKDALYNVVILEKFVDVVIIKKDYFIFDKKELENFCFDYSSIKFLLTQNIENSILNFEEEINEQLKISVLYPKDFYVNKLTEIRAITNFNFINDILSSRLINGLDNYKTCVSFANEILAIKKIQYIENKIFDIENPKIELAENTNNKLTQKQIVLLFQCLSEIGVFQKNKVSQDNTKQIKLIALIVGIAIPDKPNNWDFYKYWNSVQSVMDDRQIITYNNLNALLDVVKGIGFKDLETNILQKIKELN